MHESGKIIGLLRRHHVAVHHMQRIAGLPHVQARQRPPSAAYGIKRAALSELQQTRTLERGADDLLGLLDGFGRDVLQSQAAERQRHPRLHLMAMHFGQLERAPAKIADDPVGLVEAGHDAERGKLRLALAGEHIHLAPADALCPGDEGFAVPGVPAGGGCDHPNAATSSRSHRARNRASAASAFSTASPARSPVVWTSRPSPASTFSLKIGVGLRVRPS